MRGKGPSVSYYQRQINLMTYGSETARKKPLTIEEAMEKLKSLSIFSIIGSNKFNGHKHIGTIICPRCNSKGNFQMHGTIYTSKDGTITRRQFLCCDHATRVNGHTKHLHDCGLGDYYKEVTTPDGKVTTEYPELKYL